MFEVETGEGRTTHAARNYCVGGYRLGDDKAVNINGSVIFVRVPYLSLSDPSILENP